MKHIAAAALLLLLAGGNATAEPEQAVAAIHELPLQPVVHSSETMLVSNCGQFVYLAHPPCRAVSVNQAATELLLALGLERRMVGTAYLDAAVRPDLLPAYQQVPVLAAKAPGRESLLAEEPDFVYATFSGMFSDASLGSRPMLHELGIPTYVSPVFCPGRKEPLTLEELLGEILDIGGIFKAQGRADALVADIRQRVARTAAKLKERGQPPVRAFLFDMDDRSPYTAGRLGPQQLLLTLAGAENIFSDIEARMANVSWEAVLERDPELIVIVDSLWSTAAHKLDLLQSNPALHQLRAVRTGRLVTMPFPDLMPGIRFGESVEKLAAAFHPEAQTAPTEAAP
ncbi:ABC transporter substrate-binding protein [Candidatus Electronema sp. JC]|uniref:ABC transporter substrate-binding protein n=1 Tax=Candidatus Electronema sp. JC TaxID=3401570 RepID=UPI003B42FB8F